MKTTDQENMSDHQLKMILQDGIYDFSDDFSKKTMDKIVEIQHYTNGKDWGYEFRRLVLPAAAVLVLLIGLNLIIDRNLSKDSIIGTTDLVENQFRVFALKQLGFFIYR